MTSDRYTECADQSRPFRVAQHLQLQRLTLSMVEDAELHRKLWFAPDTTEFAAFVQSTDLYRQSLAALIGFPPRLASCAGSHLLKTPVGEDRAVRYSRLHIPVSPGLDCYGLLLEPKPATPEMAVRRRPLMVCLHGGGGCPEAVCGLIDTGNYNYAGRRLAEEGYVVFAPLLTFASIADAGVEEAEGATERVPCSVVRPEGRMQLDTRAKWLGTSLAALELLKIVRSVDTLLSLAEVDPQRLGVAGLSYGGFYALLLAALDTRVKVCISSCMFSDRAAVQAETLLWPDMLFSGALLKFTDVELAGLVCPRRLWVEAGSGDERLPVWAAAKASAEAHKWYRALGLGDRFRFHAFEGGHEFHLHPYIEGLREVWGP